MESISSKEDLMGLSVEELTHLKTNVVKALIIKQKPNKCILFNKVDKLLKSKGFVPIPNKDEKWSINKDKKLVIFNCPHFCGKFDILSSTLSHSFKMIHEVKIQSLYNDDIIKSDIELYYNGFNLQLDHYMNNNNNNINK